MMPGKQLLLFWVGFEAVNLIIDTVFVTITVTGDITEIIRTLINTDTVFHTENIMDTDMVMVATINSVTGIIMVTRAITNPILAPGMTLDTVTGDMVPTGNTL